MTADLDEKTDRYERLLAEALEAAEPAADGDATAAAECLEMAGAYLEDGRHFREVEDPVNALAAFAYGHGWLDAGVRLGVLRVPEGSELFTV